MYACIWHMRAAHFVLSTPSCDRTNGTGSRRGISCHCLLSRMQCCRDILEQARLSTNDGGVGTSAGGPCWSHDALGAEYIHATKLHICALITHTFD
jgi:hypothetical protein